MKLLKLEMKTEDPEGRLSDFVLVLIAIFALFYPGSTVVYEVKDA